jgi:tetratricopeptide (TPR) repeat protein
MQYKDVKKDLKVIGRELGARFIVGGSVRKFQDNVRITTQLVDIETNRQLWGNTYKGKLDDIFDIQEQVANQIVEALRLKLTFTEKISLTKRSTVNAQAYDLYLRGKDYLYRLSKRNAEYAIQLFEKAIELDPRYAAAYAGCSTAYGMLYQWVSQQEQYKDKAQELSFRSLMYDNNLPEAYAAMGFSYFIWNKYEEAAESSKKAIELDPEDFVAYWILGRIYYSNKELEEALPLFLKVLELKPSFYVAYPDLKIVYHGLKREKEALKMLGKVLEVLPNYLLQCPDDARARMIFSINLAEAGRREEALREGNLALEMSPGDPLMLYNGACLYSQLGEIKLSIKTLQNAIATGHSNFNWIKNDSDLDPIRSDPEYIEIMKGR